MSKLVELTRYGRHDAAGAGKALIDPAAVALILEVQPVRGLESHSIIELHNGHTIEICEAPDFARQRLGL